MATAATTIQAKVLCFLVENFRQDQREDENIMSGRLGNQKKRVTAAQQGGETKRSRPEERERVESAIELGIAAAPQTEAMLFPGSPYQVGMGIVSSQFPTLVNSFGDLHDGAKWEEFLCELDRDSVRREILCGRFLQEYERWRSEESMPVFWNRLGSQEQRQFGGALIRGYEQWRKGEQGSGGIVRPVPRRIVPTREVEASLPAELVESETGPLQPTPSTNQARKLEDVSFEMALELAEEMSKDDLAQRFEGSCTVCSRGHKAEFCPSVPGNEVCLDLGSLASNRGPSPAGKTEEEPQSAVVHGEGGTGTGVAARKKTGKCYTCGRRGHDFEVCPLTQAETGNIETDVEPQSAGILQPVRKETVITSSTVHRYVYVPYNTVR